MRLTTFIPVVLGLIGLGIVAFVRAQDAPSDQEQAFRPRTLTSTHLTGTPDASEDVPSPFRFAQESPSWQPSAQRSERLEPQPVAAQALQPTAAEPSRGSARRGLSLQERLQSLRQSRTEDPVPAVADDDSSQSGAFSTAHAADASAAGVPSVLTARRSAPGVAPASPMAVDGESAEADSAPSSRRPSRLPAVSPSDSPQVSGTVLSSSQSPTLQVQTTGPGQILIGKTATYTITIANAGEVAARDIVLSVQIPEWTELLGTDVQVGQVRSESAVGGAGQFKWSIGQLNSQTRQQLTFRLVPRESRPFDLAVHWTFAPAGALAQIEVQEPKLALTLFGPKEINYGETKIYTITVSNPGTGDAENVVINLLPITPGQESSGVSRIGTLRAGERKVIEIELTARQSGTLAIKAQAFADGGLKADAGEDVLVRRAHLELELVGPQMKYAGSTAKYQIRVVNTGNTTAENVVVQAALPTGAKYISSTGGGEHDQERQRVAWTIGSLRAGDEHLLDLTCDLASAGANRLDLRSEAAGDLSTTGTLVTQVEALADLKLVIDDPQGPVPVGEDMVYEVRIINRGTKAAEMIHAIVYFSPGIEPVAVEGGRAELQQGQVTFQPIKRLEAGEELLLKVTARADMAGNHVFRAEVKCADPETRLANEETTRFYAESTPAVRHATRPRRTTGQPTPAGASANDSGVRRR